MLCSVSNNPKLSTIEVLVYQATKALHRCETSLDVCADQGTKKLKYLYTVGVKSL